MASGTTTLQFSMVVVPAQVGMQTVQPAFHMAPTLPDAADVADNGTSLYTLTPGFQTTAVPDMGTRHRTVADAAVHADLAKGQYVAVIAPGNSTENWLSAGGTRSSMPQ